MSHWLRYFEVTWIKHSPFKSIINLYIFQPMHPDANSWPSESKAVMNSELFRGWWLFIHREHLISLGYLRSMKQNVPISMRKMNKAPSKWRWCRIPSYISKMYFSVDINSSSIFATTRYRLNFPRNLKSFRKAPKTADKAFSIRNVS